MRETHAKCVRVESSVTIHAWKYYQTVNAVSSSCVTLKIFFLDLSLTVTEINIKKVQKDEGWNAKKYANKVG